MNDWQQKRSEELGADAYREGRLEQDNPYHEESRDHRLAWEKGFKIEKEYWEVINKKEEKS